MSDPWAPKKILQIQIISCLFFVKIHARYTMHVKLHAKMHANKSRLSLSIWPRVKNGTHNNINNNKFKNINK